MQRRLKALDLMQRLEDQELRLLSRDLTRAQGARAAAEGEIAALDQRAGVELQADCPEALPYIGRFLAELRREQDRQRRISQEMTGRIDQLQDGVMGHFTRQKSYERLGDGLKAEARAAMLAAEEAQMADLTLARHSRSLFS